MSDISADVAWREVLRETEAGDVPQSRAIVAPLSCHSEILAELSRLILGDFDLNNPDLLIIGSLESDKGADIASCRKFIEEISLRPFRGDVRLGVILNVDLMLLPAANSLLKLTEEPPSHARLLFLLEDLNRFLPTLKSRCRLSVLSLRDEHVFGSMPATEDEWLEWLSRVSVSAKKLDKRDIKNNKDKKENNKNKRDNIDVILDELEGWTSGLVSSGRFVEAAEVDRIRKLFSKRNLSQAMMIDVIMIAIMMVTKATDVVNSTAATAIKESDVNFEHIFDGVWQA